MSTATCSSPFAFSSMAGVAKDDDAQPNDTIMEHMAAGAFTSLCDHLRLHSDDVQNIDLMTIGGFCRNCLAKWMVLEARTLSQYLVSNPEMAYAYAHRENGEQRGRPTAIQNAQALMDVTSALDGYGYDEAAFDVYGASYPDWKALHQKKASAEQMELYNKSAHIHAKHNSDTLKTLGLGGNPVKPLSKRVMLRLRAGAFLSLCHHLRNNNSTVQNMDLMTISGFCRNCLAKWLVLEARKVAAKLDTDVITSSFTSECQRTVKILDSFGYDEAAQYVYSCTYPEWKKRHQKKASDAQIDRYNASKHLHAKHDKDLLAALPLAVTHTTAAPDTKSEETTCTKPVVVNTQQTNPLLSDVCCQEVDAVSSTGMATQPIHSTKKIPRPKGSLNLKVGILTVSDRAAANKYETGDLSGPAVESTLAGFVEQMDTRYGQNISVASIQKKIVPDEVSDIKDVLLSWSGKLDGMNESRCDLILTTGGTGFSARDVTPEATLSILDRNCQGLMSWASMELTVRQPLATLSRAVAGTCGKALIVNLPGNPTGAAQVTELLFPLLLHALQDLNESP